MPGQHRLCRACATERDATAVQRREDDRLKFNGTQAWWITRGYDPVFIAALLVQRDVQPGQVHPRAPKDLRALLSSEVSAPFGEVSKHQGSRRGSPQLVVHCRRPARLRPTTPRPCDSCAAAALVARRSPASWSAHPPAATTCRGPGARGVVSIPERHRKRAMGAAFTRPTSSVFGTARARAYGVCRSNGQSARPLGTTRRHTPSGGYYQAAGPHHAPIRRQTDGFALGVTRARVGVYEPRSWCHVGNTSWLALGPRRARACRG